MSRHQDELRDLLAVAFECFPIGAAIFDLDGTLLYVNPAICALLARSAEEIRGHQLAEFLDPTMHGAASEVAASVLGGTVDHYRVERRFLRPDGSHVRLDVTGTVLRTAAGRPRAVLALGSEVPDPTTAALPTPPTPAPESTPAIREEFDSFCHTVSQEFRVPLRIIEGYSEIVVEDCGEILGEVALRYLGTIRDQSRRLSRVIEHTLSLARITSGPLQRESVDLSALAEDAAAMVRAEAHARGVEVRIEAGLRVDADPRMLGQLLERLFANALRFSSAAPDPCLELGRRQEDQETVFFVRDNGSGFDTAAAARLFVPFTTRHERETAGTGVGLAEVKRIVMRHGGRIWADGAPGCGATFYFTLAPPGAASSPAFPPASPS